MTPAGDPPPYETVIPVPVATPSIGLRDWFAGQALVAFLGAEGPHQPYSQDPPELSAKRAYEYADAMLKAREVS